MKRLIVSAVIFSAALGTIQFSSAQQPAPGATQPPPADVICFESRKGASEVVKRDLSPGVPNVICSERTGAVLWWRDPFDGTVPMGAMPELDQIPADKAVVRPRSEKLAMMPLCGTACHNGVGPEFNPPKLPADNRPAPNPTMAAMVPDLQNLQHGRGRIWCMDCHHNTQRNRLVDNFGDPVSFDQPQLLCGKCHGDKLRDWRDGIHGKRTGEWASTGKKRWFTCTECHNPHNVQDGARNRGFIQIAPESPPQLPLGMKDASWEKQHGAHP